MADSSANQTQFRLHRWRIQIYDTNEIESPRAERQETRHRLEIVKVRPGRRRISFDQRKIL